jgi:hypothetical protein
MSHPAFLFKIPSERDLAAGQHAEPMGQGFGQTYGSHSTTTFSQLNSQIVPQGMHSGRYHSPGKSEVHVEVQQPMQGAELSALLENQRLIEERMKKEVSMAQFKAKTSTNA